MAAGLKYRIVGRRGVGAFKTGQVVDGDDLAGTNIQALLDGGHIVVIHKVESSTQAQVKED